MGTDRLITWETVFTFNCPVHKGSIIRADVKDHAATKREVHLYCKGDKCGCKFRSAISDFELQQSSAPFQILNSIPARKH